jgi:uncharacterized protein YuzE
MIYLKANDLEISYDPEADAAYIRIRTGQVSKTVEKVSNSVMMDYDTKGNLLGIEILSPAANRVAVRQFLGKLSLKNGLPALKKIRPEAIPGVFAPA